MQNNLMYLHSVNHTRTHIQTITDFSDKTVNAPVFCGKITGPLAAGSEISVSGINLLNTPYKYAINGFSDISLRLSGLKGGTEYIFYCDKIERGGDLNPCLRIDGKVVYSNANNTFSEGKAIKFTPTTDAPEALIYSNGYNYTGSQGIVTTVYGMRIYESRFAPTVYAPYAAPQTVNIPYELADGDVLEFSDSVILTPASGAAYDITDTETGRALKALKSFYPATKVSGCEISARALGGL